MVPTHVLFAEAAGDTVQVELLEHKPSPREVPLLQRLPPNLKGKLIAPLEEIPSRHR